jgi:hypothetical protein
VSMNTNNLNQENWRVVLYPDPGFNGCTYTYFDPGVKEHVNKQIDCFDSEGNIVLGKH